MGFVSPTAPGSLGDQAMLDAAMSHVENVIGGTTAVFPHAPAMRSKGRLYSGSGRLSSLLATGRGVLACTHVAYIGADVLDGVYSAQSSLKRLKVLQVAQKLGRKVRVMGSSWSETPAQEVIDFLISNPKIEVLARDPISRGRMEKDLKRDIRLVADLGFLMKAEAKSVASQRAVEWAKNQKADGATILGVNLSGHTVRTLADRSVTPFSNLISRWLDADASRRLLFIPHDVRPGFGGDLTVLETLASELAPRYANRMHVPDGTLDAWDAKAIAGAVDLVLTGRMHLAIAALGQGTPPVSVVYQGKFEGLMAHFGLEGLTVAPETIDKDQVADECLSAATACAPALKDQINGALPKVAALSLQNFEGF